METFKNKITKISVELGFVSISKDNLIYFPKGQESLRIIGIFENEDEPVQLTYNPQIQRIFGLTGWFRSNDAQAGDFIKFEVREPFKIYKLIFEKSIPQLKQPAFSKISKKKGRDVFRFGETINFRGITYAPVNEQGVVLLFSKVHEDLGIEIQGIQQAFPDAKGLRFDGKSRVEERIEFEYKSSEFINHGHDIDKCDIVVCWIHDWEDYPQDKIEIIELKSVIRELSK